MKAGWLLLILLLSPFIRADVRPVSSVMLPINMPVTNGEGLQGRLLRVGLPEENHAPWAMRVGNDLYGIDADFLAALSQLTGTQFSLTFYADNTQLLRAVQQGTVDFALGSLPSPLPAGLTQSDVWYNSPIRIYRNRQNQRAVMFNSQNAQLAISQSTLRQLPATFVARHHWQHYPSDLQALYTLMNQQNDYVVADETSASFLLSQLQQGQIYQIASDQDAGQVSLLAIAHDATLIDWINQSLRQLPAEWVNMLQGRWITPLPRYQDTQTLTLTAAEREWLTHHPHIDYVAESDNYPWSYRDNNGTPRGYGIDLLNAMSQSTGLTFTPHWVDNPQQAAGLMSQHQVMLQLMQPLNGETMQSATLPVWRALWGIYSNSGTNFSHWRDLQGKRVGVLRDDLANQLLPPGLRAQTFADRNSLYDALANGQIDALVDNVLSARWRIAGRYRDQLHLAFAASDIAWPVALGVSPQQPPLRRILDRALQQIPADTQRQMRDTWSMPPQPGSTMAMRSLPAMVLAVAGVAIVVLLILLIRRYLQQRRERLQREQAERANAMKSQFLATVSHELRTPMQAILGLLELEKGQSQNPNATLLHSSAKSLMTLLNDLQDHARIESNSFALAPRPLDLAEWLEQQRRYYHPLMREDGPILRVNAATSLPRSVMMDSDRLQQVINNLMTNALKFTRHGEICVTLTVGEAITLSVRDSGSGIPPQEQHKLFNPWYQAPSGKTVSVQGSGLGLFICREIVQRMGGDIHLVSSQGQGTQVTVTLPLILCDEPATLSDQDWPACPHIRAAIVDDHPANLLVMQQQLARFAIQADCFEHGRSLLKADAAQPYDLLFIDQMMPHPDGPLLLRILRRRERQRDQHALKVICSADSQLLKLDLQDNERVLIKPVQLADIASLLDQLQPDPLASLDDNLWQLAQRNEKYLNRIIETLGASLQKERACMEAARRNGDWSQLADAAHRMKGSWLLIGLQDGVDLCQTLVDNARQHQDDVEAWRLLVSLTNRLLKKLDSYGTHSLSSRA